MFIMNTKNFLAEITFDFVSGNRVLDFINTEVIRQEQRVDLLVDFEHFIVWLIQTGLLNEDKLLSKSDSWPEQIDKTEVMTHVRQLRYVLRTVLEQIIARQTIEEKELELLNNHLKLYSGFYQLKSESQKISQQFLQSETAPLYLLTPLVKEIADLLSEANFSLIKRCNNPKCIRYFYDTTRNRSRRWCSMETCGNRIKVASYYQRKRNSSK